MEYYVAIKRNELLIPAATWINPETSCQVKEARHKRPHIIYSTYMQCSQQIKHIKSESQSVVTRHLGERGIGTDYLLSIGFPFGVMEMFCN